MNATATSLQPLPPYVREPHSGLRTVWISAGPQAWERARAWDRDERSGLVAPPGKDPEGYDWAPMVRGRNVALIATDMAAEDAAALLRAVMRDGATSIAVLWGSADHSRMELIANGRNV